MAAEIASLDEVLLEINRETLVALDQFLPRAEDALVAAVLQPEERGTSRSGDLAARLRRSLAEPIRTVLDRGGKGWRSYTIAAACQVVGGSFSAHRDWLALPELLHVGSLIIDDVQDKSALRRGGPTCHRVHGQALAINAGTFAYFVVQPLFERYTGPDAVRAALYREYVALLRAAHAGQGLDLLGLEPLPSEDPRAGAPLVPTVLELHRLKSGVAFRAFARMGAWLGQGDAAQIDALGEFFAAVGTAFQIIDDVLAIEGFEGALKTPLEDLAAGKVSHPVALALDCLAAAARTELLAALRTRGEPSALARAVALLASCDATTRSREEARRMVQEATRPLTAVIPDSASLQHLLAFAWRVLDRVY